MCIFNICICIYVDTNTRIDVLWPAAISCQTVLTAPINDPNPPLWINIKTKPDYFRFVQIYKYKMITILLLWINIKAKPDYFRFVKI